MPNRSRKTGGATLINQRRRTSNSVKAVKSSLSGGKLSVNPDPGSTVEIPWNNLVLLFNTTSTGSKPVFTIDSQAISEAICIQLGFPKLPLEFRLFMIKSWAQSGGSIGVRIFDTITPGGNNTLVDLLATIKDHPGMNHLAAVGYKFSSTYSHVPLSATNNQKVFEIETHKSTLPDEEGNSFNHLHLVWRNKTDINSYSMFRKINNFINPEEENDDAN